MLDPRFKDTLWSRYPDLFRVRWLKECKELMFKMFVAKFPLDGESSEESSGGSAGLYGNGMGQGSKKAIDRLADKMDDFLGAYSDETPSLIESPTDELKRFLGSPTRITFRGDPLAWWRNNALQYPRVAQFARDILAIPGSSVCVERVLSSGRDMLGVRRTSLGADTMRLLMRSKSALKLERQAYKSMTPEQKAKHTEFFASRRPETSKL